MSKTESLSGVEIRLRMQILEEERRLQAQAQQRSVQGRYRRTLPRKGLVHTKLTSGKLERLQRCLERLLALSTLQGKPR
jgi:hypothetical protein